MGTRVSFPGGEIGRGVKLTTRLHLVPRSKNEWSYTSSTQYAFMAWCLVKSTGTNLPINCIEQRNDCERLLDRIGKEAFVACLKVLFHDCWNSALLFSGSRFEPREHETGVAYHLTGLPASAASQSALHNDNLRNTVLCHEKTGILNVPVNRTVRDNANDCTYALRGTGK
jgi:hypothetical protein